MNEQPKDPLHDAHADGPVVLTDENMAKADKAIADTLSSLEFFRMRLASGTLYQADVQTHLELLRYGFNDLNNLLYGGQFLSDKLEETMSMLRETNAKLQRLDAQIGASVNAVSGQAFLRHMEKAIITWYELSGFHYASSDIRSSGIELKFSSEIEAPLHAAKQCDTMIGDKEIAQRTKNHTPWRFGSGYNIHMDGLRMNLLDTDTNREQLKNLFSYEFPKSHIIGFSSRQDRNLYLLRTNVFIPFQDIEDWLNKNNEK